MFRVVLLLLLLLWLPGCDRLLQRQVETALTRETDLLEGEDMTVVLCGTGSPLPDPDRAGACTAILAGGEFVLVDSGSGSWENIDLAHLPTGRLSAVLLTHFHSDHIGDLGETITQSWIAGRSRPLDIYGPPGTARVVDGFVGAYAQDADYRTAHHGETHMPRAIAPAVAHEVALGDAPEAAAVVFDRNGLRVTMFNVDHHPVHPAVGYRFDYRGNIVVVSGDTKKAASVQQQAAGADLLIHEALSRDMIGRVSDIARQLGHERIGALAHDTLDYHTSPVEAAEIARDAQVRTLVFSHVVPGPRNAIMRRMFLDGTDDVFTGEIVLGEDGQRFTLKPKS